MHGTTNIMCCCSWTNKNKKPCYKVKIFKFIGASLSPNPPPKVRLPNSSSWPLLLDNHLTALFSKTLLWNGDRWCYWFCTEGVEMVVVVVVVELFLLVSDRASWNWIMIRRYVATAPTICNSTAQRDFRVTLTTGCSVYGVCEHGSIIGQRAGIIQDIWQLSCYCVP